MSTEHELVSLLEGCLTCAPELNNMPIGAKVRKAVERFYQAEALGFPTTVAMDAHAAWLKQHGSPEYKAWLASFVPSEQPSGAHHG